MTIDIKQIMDFMDFMDLIILFWCQILVVA